jgi:hypothetical protein
VLPPTETEPHHTLVQTDWKDKKITAYSFSLPFGEGNDKVKAEILAQVVQSLGKPTSIEEDEFNKGAWRYHFKGAANTKVQLFTESLGGSWRLEVGPAK